MTKTKFYAVNLKAGYKPCIYTSWKAAFDQGNGFSSVKFKPYKARKEAEKFILECDDEDPTRKADHVDRCDFNKNENNQAPEDSEDCNTTQQYVLVDECIYDQGRNRKYCHVKFSTDRKPLEILRHSDEYD